jgi:hypothetical protein
VKKLQDRLFIAKEALLLRIKINREDTPADKRLQI